MKQYTDVLNLESGVSSWIVRRSHTTENQRYLLADRPESERVVDTSTVNVTVFSNRTEGQGRAEFTLFGHDPQLDRQRVKDAVFSAALQSNQPYRLPGRATMPVVETADPALAGDVRSVIDGLQDRIFAAVAAEDGVRLSAAELFVTRGESELETSAGASGTAAGTTVYLEFVLLSGSGSSEVESFGQYRARRLVDLDVESVIRRHARRSRDTQVADLPTTGVRAVVLSEGAFLPLLSPFRFATSGAPIFRKMSPLTVGVPVLGDRVITGDTPTIHSDPSLPFGTASRAFDGDGLALARIPVIDGGVFKAMAASKRYADYLGVPATGRWSNAVLQEGSRAAAELLEPGEGSILHVVDFSWLNPSNQTGDFSTEIRLGYEISSSGTRVIKGGSLSGNVYDAFAAAHFSRETSLEDGYFGPEVVRFDALQVTGA